MIMIIKTFQDLRAAVQTEIQNGGNPFALNIELPKYENLPFYKEWLPINALFVVRKTLNFTRKRTKNTKLSGHE